MHHNDRIVIHFDIAMNSTASTTPKTWATSPWENARSVSSRNGVLGKTKWSMTLSVMSISTLHQAATQQSTGGNRPWNAEHWINGNVYKWASPLPNPFKHPTHSSTQPIQAPNPFKHPTHSNTQPIQAPNPFKHPTHSSSCLEMAEYGASDVPRNPRTPAIADHTSCLPLHLVNSHAFRTSGGKTGKNCKRKELALGMSEELLVRLTK